MCVDIYCRPFVLQVPRIAFKAVLGKERDSDGKPIRLSEYRPGQRSEQFGRHVVNGDSSAGIAWTREPGDYPGSYRIGDTYRYDKGAYLHSPIPKTPGMYLLDTELDATRYCQFQNKRAYVSSAREFFRVIIPAGATVIKGSFHPTTFDGTHVSYDISVILADTLLVLE